MKAQWIIGLVFLILTSFSWSEEVIKLSLKPTLGMTRADLYHVDTVRNPAAVLVLCPGCNGNGEELISDPQWQMFAKKQNLGLAGISFASRMEDLHNGKGYYYAHNGSGKLLLEGISKLFGRDLPVLIYGFSGGAHFTSRFVEWKPERVTTWCAYSAGWWDEPKPSHIMPPGIVACGENDERLGASLVYFKQGRAAGKPWLWIGIPNNGHSPDKRTESFVRDYFVAILANSGNDDPTKSGLWIDVDQRSVTDIKVVRQYPSITGWLPNTELLNLWQSLNGK